MTEPGGLSTKEALERLRRHGRNELTSREGPSFWKTLGAVLTEPMLILLLACGTLYLLLGDRGEAGLLFTFVLLVIALTLWQERRTERAVAALRSMQSPSATVVRDGTQQTIGAAEVVQAASGISVHAFSLGMPAVQAGIGSR